MTTGMIRLHNHSNRPIRPHNLSPQILLLIQVAEGIWAEDGDELTITSLADGAHSHTSLHYRGDAVDFRLYGIKDPARKVARLKERMGGANNKDYDIILEGDHIHAEYQPRSL